MTIIKQTTPGPPIRSSSIVKNEHEVSSLISLRAKPVTMNKLRLAVILILVVAVFAASLTLYYVATESEEDGFQEQFEADASIVLDSVEDIAMNKFQALSSLAVAFTAQAIANNNTWPFVTLNSFHERAASVRKISGALLLEILPIVTDDDRVEWEAYSVQRLGWVQGGRAYQKNEQGDANNAGKKLIRKRNLNGESSQLKEGSGLFQQPPPSPTLEGPALDFSASGSGNRIYSIDKNLSPYIDPGPGYYAPIWQSSPVLDLNLVNFNFMCFQDQAPGIIAAYESGQVGFSGMDLVKGVVDASDVIRPQFAGHTSTLIDEPASAGAEKSGSSSSSSSAVVVVERQRLQSTVFFPVFDSHDMATRKPVAVLVAIMDWATFLDIPPNSDGLVIVLAVECDVPYTYKIEGGELRLLGEGDLHDSKYDSFERSATLDSVIGTRLFGELGLVLHQDWCGYSFHVYPSDELYGLYTTNTPLLVALFCAGVFLFTALMCCVVSRLADSSSVAVEKGVNVSSSSSKKTAYDERPLLDDISCVSATEDTSVTDRKNGAKDSSSSHSDDCDGCAAVSSITADLYPHTTVIFCDIWGLAAWSATREPAHVFLLLQTIYQAFDEIAIKHGIFKVESIGDSYVAVTGLPHPQLNHATLMARFAFACQKKMRELVLKLEKCFGTSTAGLAMRFGLHSGPVTASILRGYSAQFRIRGDTVNVARKMERTGARDRIQVSNATARILSSAGKGHWLVRCDAGVDGSRNNKCKSYWLTRTPQRAKFVQLEQGVDMSSVNVSGALEHDLLKGMSAKKHQICSWKVEVLTSQMKKIVAKRTALRDSSEASLNDVAALIALPEVEDSDETIEIDERVMLELETLVEDLESACIEDPWQNAGCWQALSAVDEYMKSSSTTDRVLDEDDLLSHLALLFAAFVHDVKQCGVTKGVGDEAKLVGPILKDRGFSSCAFWDIIMTDRFIELRAFLFADPVECYHFHLAVDANTFDKDPGDISLVQTSNETESTEIRSTEEETFNVDANAFDKDPGDISLVQTSNETESPAIRSTEEETFNVDANTFDKDPGDILLLQTSNETESPAIRSTEEETINVFLDTKTSNVQIKPVQESQAQLTSAANTAYKDPDDIPAVKISNETESPVIHDTEEVAFHVRLDEITNVQSKQEFLPESQAQAEHAVSQVQAVTLGKRNPENVKTVSTADTLESRTFIFL